MAPSSPYSAGSALLLREGAASAANSCAAAPPRRPGESSPTRRTTSAGCTACSTSKTTAAERRQLATAPLLQAATLSQGSTSTTSQSKASAPRHATLGSSTPEWLLAAAPSGVDVRVLAADSGQCWQHAGAAPVPAAPKSSSPDPTKSTANSATTPASESSSLSVASAEFPKRGVPLQMPPMGVASCDKPFVTSPSSTTSSCLWLSAHTCAQMESCPRSTSGAGSTTSELLASRSASASGSLKQALPSLPGLTGPARP
mmetsp:Transcript_128693/g.372388  ORF Transcript_128693/g.372388 Transcript_128693/m.372388 type:complete len:258 (-) Transcript_128693:204-977(-)